MGRLIAAAVAALLLALVAAGLLACGDGGDDAASAGGPGVGGEGTRVAYVVDAAGVEDGGFNQLGAEGLERAAERYGVETKVAVAADPAQREAEVAALAEQGFNLVIVAGFNLIEAVTAAAERFPETSFAITDVSVEQMPGAGENLRGLPFEQAPAGQLAGYLAGLVALESAGEGALVGAIGGQRIPPVESWLGGFETGLAEASPSLELRTDYSGSFVEPARCRRIARRQVAAGAVVIFEAAARCGLAAIELASERGVWTIGTDGQYFEVGESYLGSGLKRTDLAVYETVEDFVEGDFRGGEDRLFTIADDGVGLSDLGEAVPAAVREKVEARANELAAEAAG